MRLKMYQVDAFTPEPFRGNPAAVCPLERWLPDGTMQNIALENNLSETAFFVREGGAFALRWFTPTVEVDLCGHATLASAFVLFHVLNEPGERVEFRTRSGSLSVARRGDLLELDFPAKPPRACDPPPGLIDALGAEPADVLVAIGGAGHGNYLAVYDSERAVRGLAPDFAVLRRLEGYGVIATAPGDSVDFVSRYFAAAYGVDEDPVTGSSHCTLTPYWAGRLGKSDLSAQQVSKRGGDLRCRLAGDRVHIAGHAVLYLWGEIEVPE
jgi:PhzF family phenazine biosynthesis protein